MNAILPARSANSMQAAPIRLVMIDDSIVMRSVIGRIFDDIADIELVCRAGSLSEAYGFLAEQTVDIVLLDHEMPGQKGLDALPHLLGIAGTAHIIMLSSHCQRGSQTAVAALSLGASDALAKPSSGENVQDFTDLLLSRIRRLGASRHRRPVNKGPLTLRPVPEGFKAACIGIGASTGGIHALDGLLRAMTGKPGVPILITQHLPAPFTPHYARQVAQMCKLPVSVAQEGEVLRPDHVYIAPGDASLSCVRRDHVVRAALIAERDKHSLALPSVNSMFAGMARSYGAGALGIVLTGIGRDGTAGARLIAEADGALIVQDRESSIVWGMPGSVASTGLASASLMPADMPLFMRARCGVAV